MKRMGRVLVWAAHLALVALVLVVYVTLWPWALIGLGIAVITGLLWVAAG